MVDEAGIWKGGVKLRDGKKRERERERELEETEKGGIDKAEIV